VSEPLPNSTSSRVQVRVIAANIVAAMKLKGRRVVFVESPFSDAMVRDRSRELELCSGKPQRLHGYSKGSGT
jgi:hypothetical protein